MDAQHAVGELAARWQAHCKAHADRFESVSGTLARRKRIEACESQLIDALGRPDVSLSEKAVAFRSIVELRGCTARDVATFFQVDPQVVVVALSLLELPQVRTKQVAPPSARATKSKSRTSAA